MPGFDIDRINSTSEAELEELTCSICHGIFNKPVFTNCCLQTFCKDCIEGWIKSSKSCTYDRKELSTDKLSQPPRFVFYIAFLLSFFIKHTKVHKNVK